MASALGDGASLGVSERRSAMDAAIFLPRPADAEAPTGALAVRLAAPVPSRARRAADRRPEAACARLPGSVVTPEDFHDLYRSRLRGLHGLRDGHALGRVRHG